MSESMQPYTQLIDGDALERQAQRNDWRIVDCRFDLLQPSRGQAEYDAGHIPGAVYAHLDRDLAAPLRAQSGRHPLPDAEQFAASMRRIGISRESQVVVYDAGSGGLAARLWWLLRWQGHTAVAVLDGGLADWQRAGRGLSPQPAEPRPGNFSAGQIAMPTVDTAEIAQRLNSPEPLLLVDARDAERFAGRQEPIDAVAGHIPGAINFPFAQNISASGAWQAAATLRTRWRAALGDAPPPEWAVMCGSGVTACSLVLSAEIAALPVPRLYAGSWSEWIRDASRPVAP